MNTLAGVNKQEWDDEMGPSKKSRKALSTINRLDRLLQLIDASGHVTVTDVCEKFSISEATARRDLDLLSQAGQIQRVHGGAVSINKGLPPENPVYQRISHQAECKKRIGQATTRLILPGETIFLGSGTTVLEVARYLDRQIELTVITNSLLVINHLLDYQNIMLISLGGVLRFSELSMIGNLTEDNLSGLHADKVIMGIHAIDLTRGLTNHYLPETVTDRKVLQMGKSIIIVADHTKCGQVSTAHVAPITVMDTLVTDTEAPPDFVEALRLQDIKVIQA